MRGQEFRTRKYKAKLTGRVIPQQGPRFRSAVQAQVQAEQFVKSLNMPAIHQNYYMIFAKEVKSILRKHKGNIAPVEACIAWQRWYSRGLSESTLNDIMGHYGLPPCAPPIPCEDWLTQEECEAAGCYWYDDACHSAPPPVCDWSWKRKLTFSGNVSATDLDGFPVLVHLTPSNFNFNHARDNGEDIRFMDSDLCPSDGTPLKHEIEYWSKAGQEAFVWVKVPRIDGGSVTDFIYMYYGNPGAPDGQDPPNVWDASFLAVYHLRGDGTAAIPDSTGNANHGTKKAIGEPANITAHIDGGQSGDGTDDYIDIPTSTVLQTRATIECWVKDCAWAAYDTVAGDQGSAHVLFFYHPSAGNRACSIDNKWQAPFPVPTTTYWRYLDMTWDADLNQAYCHVDNVQQSSFLGAFAAPSNVTKFTILSWLNLAADRCLEGKIDEFRISDIVRSQDWLTATKISGNDALITYGAEEAV